MYATYLYWLDVILLTVVWGGGINASLGENRYHMSSRKLFYPVHEPSDITLIFPSPSNVWRHWGHSRCQISHEPSDIILNCTWAVGHYFNLYVGLHGPGWLYMLGMPPRGDLRLWTPRARATDLGQGPNLRRGVRAGSLRATEPRAREKTRGRKSKKMPMCKKKHIYT